MNRLDKLLDQVSIENEVSQPLSEGACERILSRVIEKTNLRQGEKQVSKKKLGKILLIAACIVIIGVTTVWAVKMLTWEKPLMDYFEPTEEQMEDLSGAVNTPQAIAEKNGVTIEVKQTLADQKSLYILYEVTVPEEFGLDKSAFNEQNKSSEKQWCNYTFEDTFFEFNTTGLSRTSNILLEQESNKMSILMIHDTGGRIENQEVMLTFENLLRFNHDTFQYEPILEEVWELKWYFDYEDTSKTITINDEFEVYDKIGMQSKSIYITDIAISPISIFIEFAAEDKEIISTWVDINIQDGSSFNCGKNDINKTFGMDADGNGFMLFRFQNIVDISEIESITIGDGTTITVEW